MGWNIGVSQNSGWDIGAAQDAGDTPGANGNSIIVNNEWKSIGNVQIYAEGSWRSVNAKYVTVNSQWQEIA